VKLRILLVDDIADFREILCTMLEMDGAEVDCAADYYMALELLDSHSYDIVITDYKMPRMHGLYLLDMVKDKYPNMPVIIISAYMNDEFRTEAKRRKADLLIEKTFEYGELLEGIRKLMRKKWKK
jgi:DNA-binding response OmpR family regulator